MVVGIFGCVPGAGVTHLCLTMATYACQYLGCKATVMECGGQDRLIHLESRIKQAKSLGENYFQIYGVDYYAKADELLVAEHICSQKGIILLDLGHDYTRARPYLMRCTRKVLLINTVPWKISYYEQFIKDFDTFEKKLKWDVTGTFTWNTTGRKGIEKENRDLLKLPFIPNPFQLTFQNCNVLWEVIID